MFLGYLKPGKIGAIGQKGLGPGLLEGFWNSKNRNEGSYCWHDDEVSSASTVDGLSCSLCTKRCHSALPGQNEKHRLLRFSDGLRIGSLADAVGASSKVRAWEIELGATEMRQTIRIRHSVV